MALKSFKAQGLVLQIKFVAIMFLILNHPFYGPSNFFGIVNLITLLGLFLVIHRENLLEILSSYFVHSHKIHIEFTKLVEILGTKGNKIIQNVKTKWILMLSPTKKSDGIIHNTFGEDGVR